MEKSILEIKNLSVTFSTDRGTISAVRDLSMSVGRGEIVAVVGESGCGKSVLCKTILGLLPFPAKVVSGSVCTGGRDLTRLSDRDYCAVRGREISMVFQDPMTSLDPSQTIGDQIAEAIRVHDRSMSAAAIRQKTVDLLDAVAIDRPELRTSAYPWMLSGGMRQRCVLAIALAGDPDLLIADEPTTALDETIRQEILDLILSLRQQRGLSVLFISHDLSTCARIADTIHIMYAGRIIETGTADEIMKTPAHPYTRGLLRALPAFAEKGRLQPIPGAPPIIPEGFEADAFAERNEYALGIDYLQAPPFFPLSPTHKAATWLADPRAPKVDIPMPHAKAGAAAEKDPDRENCESPATDRPVLLEVRDISHTFPLGRSSVRALDKVSFDIRKGETFALVGESGSGKSTLAKCVLGMIRPTSGKVIYDGTEITGRRLGRKDRMQLARKIQFISQDPGAALDQKMTVRELIAEPLQIHRMFPNRSSLDEYVLSMLQEVQLDASFLDRYPAQLSGGQKQRVSIARAYSMNPELLIADEPTSSLDVSIQAQIIELFLSLQKKHETSLLFISHDLPLVRLISDRIGIMQRGQMIKQEVVR